LPKYNTMSDVDKAKLDARREARRKEKKAANSK
jgi:KinB signaling pathway activation protein